MESRIRAKFKCSEVAKSVDGGRVQLQAVTGGPENDSFYKWTPGGGIELSILKPETLDHFVPGREYFVDFIPAG